MPPAIVPDLALPVVDRPPVPSPLPDTLSPADRYQELFVAVQSSAVFADSKTFVDCAPLLEPQAIMAAYRAQHLRAGFDLKGFVAGHFDCVEPPVHEYQSRPGQAIEAHIEALWPVLTRHPSGHASRSSLLQLPRPYVVPGGRFRELYYWDSYFTMLGLDSTGNATLLVDMLDNFAYLIDTYGHVPNGTRSYYLSRSQPPVFALMLALAQPRLGQRVLDYLPRLQQEHAWWMADAHDAPAGGARRRVVRLPDGRLLNRHWDDRDTPREESWLEDVTTARASQREPAEVYRDLRAACESGWDFSTRWLSEQAPPASPSGASPRPASGACLSTICTTDIVPVDLNAFLYKLEIRIAELATLAGAHTTARDYQEQARLRKAAMNALMWHEAQGAFFDHDWRRGEQRRSLTAATVVPLFVGLASAAQARAVAGTVSRRLLAHGGLATTEHTSAQQWDQPNGWAPLQWMAVRGLADHGETELANTIAQRWLATVQAVYDREGRLVEKYALDQAAQDDPHGGGGGEYPLQDGFGWTNGVTAALLARQRNKP